MPQHSINLGRTLVSFGLPPKLPDGMRGCGLNEEKFSRLRDELWNGINRSTSPTTKDWVIAMCIPFYLCGGIQNQYQSRLDEFIIGVSESLRGLPTHLHIQLSGQFAVNTCYIVFRWDVIEGKDESIGQNVTASSYASSTKLPTTDASSTKLPTTVKFCTKCGWKAGEGDRFCGSCGETLNAV